MFMKVLNYPMAALFSISQRPDLLKNELLDNYFTKYFISFIFIRILINISISSVKVSQVKRILRKVQKLIKSFSLSTLIIKGVKNDK